MKKTDTFSPENPYLNDCLIEKVNYSKRQIVKLFGLNNNFLTPRDIGILHYLLEFEIINENSEIKEVIHFIDDVQEIEFEHLIKCIRILNLEFNINTIKDLTKYQYLFMFNIDVIKNINQEQFT